MTTLTKAGVPLRTSAERIRERMPRPAIENLIRSLDQRSDAREAFEAGGFSPFEVNLVAAGERGGRLEGTFALLAEYYRKEQDIRRSILGALIYPGLLLHVAAFVIPLPKWMLQGLFTYVVDVIWNLGVVYAVAIACYEAIRLTWRAPGMQNIWLLFPLVRRFLRATFAYRWIVALRMEILAGIPFYQSAADAWRASGYADAGALAEDAVRGMQQDGLPLSRLILRWDRLPPEWADYLATAEYSGKIDETLATLETLAESEWRRAQNVMAKWVPRILYFLILFVVALQIFRAAYINYFEPILRALDTLPI
jgi:type II secretory pathway component PulF